VLFTLGKVFFPTMLHREKELRTRMRWVAVVFGLLLVVGMVALISYVQKSRPITVDMSQPKRR
jgi:general stress protein CsbA